jgi:hypothetical protein
VRPIPIRFKILFWVLVALTLMLLASILITGVPASSAARPPTFDALGIAVPLGIAGVFLLLVVRALRKRA